MKEIIFFFFLLMIRRPPRSTRVRSSAASDVYKRQLWDCLSAGRPTYPGLPLVPRPGLPGNTGVADVGRKRVEASQALAQYLCVCHGGTDPHIGKESPVLVGLLHVCLQAHRLA